ATVADATQGELRRPAAAETFRGAMTCTTTPPRADRRPQATVAVNSPRLRSRSLKASISATEPASDRQTRATLGAACLENGAPGARTHAQPESVGLRTPAVVRLVGALAHVGHSVFVEPSRTRRACVARLGRASHVPAFDSGAVCGAAPPDRRPRTL